MMRRCGAIALLAGAILLLTSCASSTPARVEIVPSRSQTAEQADRDRWECGLFAQQQARFAPDRSLRNGAIIGLLAGGGVGSALGAAAGAAWGMAGKGAALGAIAGGLLGAPLGSYVKSRRDSDGAQAIFRTCLEARGYTLR